MNTERIFEKAFEQAGYGVSGFTAGARDTLVRYAEQLARQHGLEQTFTVAKTMMQEKYGVNRSSDESSAVASNLTHQCMKESGAAAMSALVGGAANSLEYVELVRSGKMDGKEAFVKIIGETVASAADSALKAAGETGRQLVIDKFGSEEKALQALAEQGIQALFEKKPHSQGGGQILDTLAQIIDLGREERASGGFIPEPGSLMVQAKCAATDIGTVAGNGALDMVKSKFPSLVKHIPKHPAILAASIIAVVAGGIALKNGIEKPYQDLVRNTESLKAATSELDRVSRNLLRGQTLFGKYLEADAERETQIQNQMAAVDRAGQSALNAILKI